MLKFPANFLWGTATAPTQIEGHIHNEWTDFVANDGRNCRVACDHYHRYPEDVDWMHQLGVNAYRMGIEWSRLQSRAFAPLNRTELDRYCDLLDRLKSAGITPMVVLHHFSNPPWVSAAGGWVNPDTVAAFVDYVGKLVDAIGDRVYLWNTFNEPDTYASLGYLLGWFPPRQKWRLGSFRKVIRHMADAHVRAGEIIRQRCRAGRAAEVGIAKNWTFFNPFKKFSLWDQFTTTLCHKVFNRFVLESFIGGSRRDSSTYLGLNYYGRVRFHHFRPLIPASGACPKHLSELGLICDDMVERYPEGLAIVLRYFRKRYDLPLYLTEHGSASDDSRFRIRDLQEHLQVLHNAIRDGVDIRGFFYWSLMDTFEWQFGYTKKFGLLNIDFEDKTLPRKMTEVGEFYRTVCAAK